MAFKIDEMVVQMLFNNSQFESEANKTIGTIDRLKQSTDSLGGNATAFDPLIAALDQTQQKFSVMETVATGALLRIGYQAEALAERMVKGLTIDQVTAGWTKYEEKTRSIKTIMNATGESIDTVNGYLDKLMWYTDETSYNFTDMTNNIGKFTSQGIKLEDATTAMMGIANWAADAGQGVNEASRAMYNLSQALGMGQVRLTDWMSIENANMATKDFKEQVIQTAIELGTLSEEAKTAKGEVVNFGNFREMLSQGFFTSDVLIATLKKYGDYSEEVFKMTQEEGILASEAMERLGDSYSGVGERAFKAAQVSKTFSDALEATRDAVSSGWLSTFEHLLGNLETQEVLWTKVTDVMWELFAASGDARNELLQAWEDMGGQLVFLDTIGLLLDGIVGFMNLIGDAWRRAFPPMTAQTLLDITVALRNLVGSLELTEWASENIADAIGGVLSMFRAIGQVAFAVIQGFLPGVETLNDFAGELVGLAGAIGRVLTKIADFISTEEHLQTITNAVSKVVSGLSGIFTTLFEAITGVDMSGDGLVSTFSDVFRSIFTAISNTFGGAGDILSIFTEGIGEAFSKLSEFINGAEGNNRVLDFIKALADVIDNLVERISFGIPFLSDFLSVFGQLIDTITTGLVELFSHMTGQVDWNQLFGLASMITVLLLMKELDRLNPIPHVRGIISGIKDVMNMYNFKQFMEGMEILAKSVAILAGAISLLASLDYAKGAFAVGMLSVVAVGLKYFVDELAAMDDDEVKHVAKVGPAILMFALAMASLGSAVSKIANYDFASIAVSTAALLGVMFGLYKFAEGMQNVKIGAGTVLSLIGIVSAIELMIPALAILSLYDFASLGTGLLALAGMLAELWAFASLMQNVKVNPVVAVSLIAMAGAIDLLAIACGALSLLSLEQVGVGLLAIGGMLTELIAASALLQKVGANPATVASLLLMAAAIDVLSLAMLALGSMNIEEVGVALLAMGGALAEFTVALGLLSVLGPQVVAAGAGLTLLASSILLLTPALLVLGAVPMDMIEQGLIAVAGAVGIFVAAVYLLSPVTGTLAGIAGAFALVELGAAALVFAFAALSGSLTELAAGIILFGSIGPDTVQQACDNIKTILDALVAWILKSYIKFKYANIVLWTAMLDAIAELSPAIVNNVLSILNDILKALVEWAPELLESLMQLLTVLDEYMEPLGEKAAELIGSFLAGLIRGLEKGIEDVVGAIVDAGKRLWESFKNALFGGGSGRVEATGEQMAKDAAAGLSKGAKQSEKTAAKAGASTAQAYLDAHDEKMDRHSPSKEMEKRGEDASEGFAQGAKKSLFKFKDAATNGASTFLSSLSNALFGKKDDGAVAEVGQKTGTTFASAVDKSNGGTSAAKSMAKQLKEDTSLEDAAKEQAKKVSEAFTTEFNKISSQLSAVGSKFNIAEAYLGPEDDEGTVAKKKALLELQKMQEELQILADKYNISWDKYQNALANPKSSNEEVQSMYAEYLKTYEELAQKAASIVNQQKELYGTYEEAEEIVMAELRELSAMQSQLVNSAEVQASQATQEAYNNFVAAVTEEQKQYYYDLWNELKKADAEAVLGNIVAAPIDVNKIRKEVYSQLGLDPNNPVESFLSVEDLIGQAVGLSQQTYLNAVEETYPDIINAYESKLAESADEVLEFVDGEVSPKFARSGAMMAEATASGITNTTPEVSFAGKEMSKEARMETNKESAEWTVVGEGMMDGIIEGIENRRAEVIEAAIEVALAALAAAKNALGIASPSREFLAVGMYAIDGLRIGILEGKESVEDASQVVATGLVDQFDDVGDRISDILDGSLHPVIDPSLDLAGVKRAAKNLDNLWSSSTLRTLGDISLSELSRRDELIAARQPVAPVVNHTNTFTQNNYSPKALSDAEIYRQTKKELDWAFKGAQG